MRIALGRLKALVREALAPSESVRVRQEPADLERTRELRARWPDLPGIVVARFDGPVGLYRVVDDQEWAEITRTGRIVGGRFAVKAERAVGASWGTNLDQVIAFGLQWKRAGRLRGQLRVLRIDGYDRQFGHLEPGVSDEELSTQGARMAVKACSTGLGCSVADVTLADVDRAWELGDDGRLTPFEP